MKKRDFLLIISIILISAVLFFVRESFIETGETVLIYVDNKLYKTVSLSESCEIDVGTNTIVIENGYAYMKNATCPDKICVNTGKINDNSRDIICLPNKVMVKITKKSTLDAVSG
ncbi:MAG: NusG domain II-containing protein [Clostridia bacterium]|nr:NusG domain II-containing protein [Clostridia bacterium]